ncbi:alpha/beta hydrolase [Actinokineospora auranticolor]|uniref:Alpha/beta hydrolase family protein DUF1100 n=1 Tax=Actinokineospora auranticolor TaxID=155976 RepID=A0A2S6H1W0_9PSEU|nr:alpha/beta fold hydrolase [Actinokineospora auranticolor]PPK71407.1 alpha/beta hydrolase family protein DUF1100 [Actinokineospora auranticolor]
MSDLAELKQFVVAHAISQNLPADHYTRLLDAITTADGDGPGSWAHEWIAAGDAETDPQAATQYYVLGRFPFVEGPGRARALAKAIESFDRWRATEPAIEPRTVEVEGETITVWTAGLSTSELKPLLVLSGGIVSPKEQWAAVLPQIAAFGLAGVVTEYPGVGESPLTAHKESWRLFPAILDALKAEAKVDQTYLLALSFSGHLALRAALDDPRVRGVVGNGPPLRDFFTDTTWQGKVPAITRDTLAHLAGVTPDLVWDHVRDWALSEDDLRALSIPVAAVTARRDEIIPASDTALLRAAVADITINEHDDVHGAPSHLAETRVWSLLAVLRQWPDAHPAVLAALSAAVDAARKPAD